MASQTVRIDATGHRVLRRLCRETNETSSEILLKALEEHARKRFLDGLAEDFGRLNADPELWADELRERGEWDVAIADGLDE